MADCFWTDLVGCAEDCGSGPSPPALSPIMFNENDVCFTYPDPLTSRFGYFAAYGDCGNGGGEGSDLQFYGAPVITRCTVFLLNGNPRPSSSDSWKIIPTTIGPLTWSNGITRDGIPACGIEIDGAVDVTGTINVTDFSEIVELSETSEWHIRLGLVVTRAGFDNYDAVPLNTIFYFEMEDTGLDLISAGGITRLNC